MYHCSLTQRIPSIRSLPHLDYKKNTPPSVLTFYPHSFHPSNLLIVNVN
jgi:hypothetical protein